MENRGGWGGEWRIGEGGEGSGEDRRVGGEEKGKGKDFKVVSIKTLQLFKSSLVIVLLRGIGQYLVLILSTPKWRHLERKIEILEVT